MRRAAHLLPVFVTQVAALRTILSYSNDGRHIVVGRLPPPDRKTGSAATSRLKIPHPGRNSSDVRFITNPSRVTVVPRKMPESTTYLRAPSRGIPQETRERSSPMVTYHESKGEPERDARESDINGEAVDIVQESGINSEAAAGPDPSVSQVQESGGDSEAAQGPPKQQLRLPDSIRRPGRNQTGFSDLEVIRQEELRDEIRADLKRLGRPTDPAAVEYYFEEEEERRRRWLESEKQNRGSQDPGENYSFHMDDVSSDDVFQQLPSVTRQYYSTSHNINGHPGRYYSTSHSINQPGRYYSVSDNPPRQYYGTSDNINHPRQYYARGLTHSVPHADGNPSTVRTHYVPSVPSRNPLTVRV